MNSLKCVSGMTTLLALIADPVAQAGSPGLINAELYRRGQLGEFVLMPLHVSRDDLAAAIAGLRVTGNFRGAVVSMPHKQSIVPLLDGISARALREGACNVIHRGADGRLHGDILDGEGFVDSLKQAGHEVAGQRVLLLGAGGAASSIAFALAGSAAAAIGIRNRTLAHSAQLAAAVSADYPACEVSSVGADLTPYGVWDIVINASPLGMQPNDELPLAAVHLRATMLVADIVVSAQPTPLLLAAQRLGCRTHTGRQMLEAQKALLLHFMLEGSAAEAVS